LWAHTNIVNGKIKVANLVKLNKAATSYALTGLVNNLATDANTNFSWTDNTDTANSNAAYLFNSLTINYTASSSSGSGTSTSSSDTIHAGAASTRFLAAIDSVKTQRSVTRAAPLFSSNNQSIQENFASPVYVAFGQSPAAYTINPIQFVDVAEMPLYQQDDLIKNFATH
jgi:hypothetical protein